MIRIKNKKKLIWLIVIAEIVLYFVILWLGRGDIVYLYNDFLKYRDFMSFLMFLFAFLIPLLRVVVISVIVGLIVLVFSCLNL